MEDGMFNANADIDRSRRMSSLATTPHGGILFVRVSGVVVERNRRHRCHLDEISLRQYISTSTVGRPTVIRMMQFYSWLRHTKKPADHPQRTFLVYLVPLMASQMQGFSHVAIQSISTSSLCSCALRSWEDSFDYAAWMYALNLWRRWK